MTSLPYQHSHVTHFAKLTAVLAWTAFVFAQASAAEPQVSGELKQWHKVTLTLDGPEASEKDTNPNPFLDYRFIVTFVHESGSPQYHVPGYFAADGRAGESSATVGHQWRAHLSPDKPGKWTYTVSFKKGPNAAVDESAPAQTVEECDELTGSFDIAPTDKTGRDFRGKGRLQYVRMRYLRFAGTGEYFLKAGADSPENLLGYADFDGTRSYRVTPAQNGEPPKPVALKTWAPHVRDWKPGDPSWRAGKGKGLIGALNYLAGTGCNAFSFITYNAGGDGDDVWPFTERDDPYHFDCSKLDQWQLVFDYAQELGLYLHFKLQENENDDTILNDKPATVPTALDGGATGTLRRLYLRELIARFGYELALNWNLGEENSQTSIQQKAMAAYIRDTDPYRHHMVLHTWPGKQEAVYRPLLGDQSALTGASLQTGWDSSHWLVQRWIGESARAGWPWVVAHDEQNPSYTGVPPDPGYEGFDGTARPTEGSSPYTNHDIRKYTLWGSLMAGGAGVEYYFGYTLPQDDLRAEDWRSRNESWSWASIALGFFRDQSVAFWRMRNADELIGNILHDNSKYCLAEPGVAYVVYLPRGGGTELDLSGSAGQFRLSWFNPRAGGPLETGSVSEVSSGGKVALGEPPADPAEDWVVLVRASAAAPADDRH